MVNQTEQAANWLYAAHQNGDPFQPLSAELAPRSVDAAYRIQQAFQAMHASRDDGRGAIGGRKIALASKVQQALCDINHPIAGGIFAQDIQWSPAAVARQNYHGLGVEYEIAVTLNRRIAAAEQIDAPLVSSLIDSVHPAFELIIDRNADYQRLDALTMIADNAWCAGVVLGPAIALDNPADINNLALTLHWNDEPPQHANSSASDPLGSLAWVINLVTSMGGSIEAGELIITGSVLKTRYPVAGDQIRFGVDGQSETVLSIS